MPSSAQPLLGVAPGRSDDPHQQAVIDWRRGWAVVAAAAGSGKSFAVIQRTAALLSEGFLPESICVLAYNASAAELLRARLAALVGPSASRCQIMTFHAWSYALLRCWFPQDPRLLPGHLIGGNDGPSPYKVAAPLVDVINKETKCEITIGGALATFDRFSGTLLPLTLESVCAAEGLDEERATPYLRFLRNYAEEKRRRDLIDFADMLGDVARAISYQSDAPHVQQLTRMYRHVMVDEAQDSSLARAIIARWLGQGADAFLAIGDGCQSIARYAGARPEIFLGLARTPGVTLLRLPVNRRSTRRIVEAANEVARDREWNLNGDCLPRADAPEGEPKQVWATESAADEAERVIQDILRRGPLGTVERPNFACLARTNAMLAELECAFVARKVPVRVRGSSGGLWGTSVGLELLAYLEGMAGLPNFGLLNVLNKPKRFGRKRDLGDVVEKAVERQRRGEDASLHAALLRAETPALKRLGRDLTRGAALSWKQQCTQAARWLGVEATEEQEQAGDDRRGALEALTKLAQQLGSLDGVQEYRREAARGEKEPAVELSTIHGSKGDEWPVVYVCGVRQDALPHKRCTAPEDREEERRLLYVAVTRARDVLVLSTGGKPSPFLADLGW